MYLSIHTCIYYLYNKGDVPDELYKVDWTSATVMKKWRFSKVWKLLEEVGWKWTKGRELVSFFYIRPNCQPQPPFTNGIEYFVSEDDVMHYVTKTVEKNLAKQVQSRKHCVSEVNSNLRTSIPFQQAKNDNDAEQDTPVSYHTLNERRASKTATAAATTTRKQTSPVKKYTDNDRIPSEVASSADAAEAVVEIMSAKWNVVWKILRSKGWTWDFGTQTNSWYIAPGYTVKTAISGEQKFSDELAVRRHVRKMNMPEFENVCSSEAQQRHHIADSQMSIDVTDPQNDWQLALNRRKRRAHSSLPDVDRHSSLNSKKLKITGEGEFINPLSRVSGGKRKIRSSKKVTPPQSKATEAETRVLEDDKSGYLSAAEEPTQAQVHFLFLHCITLR